MKTYKITVFGLFLFQQFKIKLDCDIEELHNRISTAMNDCNNISFIDIKNRSRAFDRSSITGIYTKEV